MTDTVDSPTATLSSAIAQRCGLRADIDSLALCAGRPPRRESSVSHVDVLKRFATRLSDNGAKAWAESGPVTRGGALLTTTVTGTAGIAAGGLVGAYDRVWSKISDT